MEQRPKRIAQIALLVISGLCLLRTQTPEHPRYYFYRPEMAALGSESQVGVGNVFLNGAYDMLRNGGHRKDVIHWDYSGGAQQVWENARNPFHTISVFGWREFAHQEIFNFTIGVKNAEFVPNIGVHTVGNGMQYAKLAEYLDSRGVAYPQLWSGLTTTAYQVMNEIVEAEGYRGINVDLVADLYIFNLAGIGIFSTEWGKEFFSNTLPVNEWSPQPVFEPYNGLLQNTGQQYYLRKHFDLLGPYAPFMYFGVYTIFGASYDAGNGDHLTIGGGRVINKLREGRLRGFRKIDPQMDGTAGFFWDRNGSLLTSLLFTGPGLYNLQLNLYPGLLRIGSFSPGIYLAAGEWDGFRLGVTFSELPVGFGAGHK